VPFPAWPLATERLVLRPFEEDDFAGLYAIHSDERVVRWLYNEARSEEEVRALLARKMAGVALTEEGQWLSCAVTLRGTDELVGDLALQWVSKDHRCGELGFIVHPEHQGHGYATEAAAAMLPFCFDTMGFHRVIGRTEARNLGSARVLEKLAMRREAHLVENEFGKGEWQSELIYAILASEWRAAGEG
jgi:RimJ/RimL family protein N-acetyltransferase